jgi:hypothetical protein
MPNLHLVMHFQLDHDLSKNIKKIKNLALPGV